MYDMTNLGMVLNKDKVNLKEIKIESNQTNDKYFILE